MDATTSSLKLSVQKAVHVLLGLIIFLGGLYVLHYDPLNFPNAVNWLTALICFFCSAYLHSLDLLISFEDLLDRRVDEIKSKLHGVEQDFTSTVKTLNFLNKSESTSQIRVPDDTLKKVEVVVSGNVRMKTIDNFINSKTTVVLMEGVCDSVIEGHSHERNVNYFVATGEIEFEREDERTQILERGDVINVNPHVNRQIKFLKNSTIFANYIPPLES